MSSPALSAFRFCACWLLWAGPGALLLLAAVLAGSGFFCVCLSVSSEAELEEHRPENRQFSVRYTRQRRSLTVTSLLRSWASVGMFWDFGSLCHEALRRSESHLLRQKQFVLSVDKADSCVVRVCCETSYVFLCSVDTLHICKEPRGRVKVDRSVCSAGRDGLIHRQASKSHQLQRRERFHLLSASRFPICLVATSVSLAHTVSAGVTVEGLFKSGPFCYRAVRFN